MGKTLERNGISRRSFLGLAAAAGAAAAGAGLAGCAPQSASEDSSASAAETQSSNWLGSAPEIAEGDIVRTEETDLLIVGAGNGGLAAAATAVDLGVDFMLCEKNGAVQPCRHWLGAVNTKQHEAAGISIDEGRLINELSRYASNKCNQRVWRTWINESAEMIAWVESILGVSYELDTEGYDHNTGGTSYYVPPIQHMAGMGEDRDELLAAYLQSKGHDIAFGYNLQKLLREEGGPVTGAIFETSEGYVQVNAKNTILATGGYPASRTMVRELAPIIPQCVTADGFMPGNDGYGIRAALWAGAKMDAECAPMIFDRGAVVPGTDAGYLSDDEDSLFTSTYGGNGQMNVGSQPFMKVSRTGRRFANESTPYDFICHAAAQQPGGVWCQVFDSNMKEDVMRFSTVGCSKFTQMSAASDASIDEIYADDLERGFMVKGETLEELADGLGFEGEAKQAFLDQVERYNAQYDAQLDDDFGKEPFRLSALRKAPFYGTWFGGTLLTTVDGICINENMQAIDEHNEPIEGLYAVGDCSGSLFSGNYPEYIVGCACGRTLTFGRHAVRHIAGDLA